MYADDCKNDDSIVNYGDDKVLSLMLLNGYGNDDKKITIKMVIITIIIIIIIIIIITKTVSASHSQCFCHRCHPNTC